jgi:hypothetical protein
MLAVYHRWSAFQLSADTFRGLAWLARPFIDRLEPRFDWYLACRARKV